MESVFDVFPPTYFFLRRPFLLCVLFLEINILRLKMTSPAGPPLITVFLFLHFPRLFCHMLHFSWVSFLLKDIPPPPSRAPPCTGVKLRWSCCSRCTCPSNLAFIRTLLVVSRTPRILQVESELSPAVFFSDASVQLPSSNFAPPLRNPLRFSFPSLAV